MSSLLAPSYDKHAGWPLWQCLADLHAAEAPARLHLPHMTVRAAFIEQACRDSVEIAVECPVPALACGMAIRGDRIQGVAAQPAARAAAEQTTDCAWRGDGCAFLARLEVMAECEEEVTLNVGCESFPGVLTRVDACAVELRLRSGELLTLPTTSIDALSWARA